MSLIIEELLILNKYVQKIVAREVVYDWFFSSEAAKQKEIVRDLWCLAVQAQVRESDVVDAAKAAELRTTLTPVVMLSHGRQPFVNRGFSLLELTGCVFTQAFKIVLECFVLAEQRRKLMEGLNPCNHWWHKDLSDERIVKEIIKSHKDHIVD